MSREKKLGSLAVRLSQIRIPTTQQITLSCHNRRKNFLSAMAILDQGLRGFLAGSSWMGAEKLSLICLRLWVPHSSLLITAFSNSVMEGSKE